MPPPARLNRFKSRAIKVYGTLRINEAHTVKAYLVSVVRATPGSWSDPSDLMMVKTVLQIVYT